MLGILLPLWMWLAPKSAERKLRLLAARVRHGRAYVKFLETLAWMASPAFGCGQPYRYDVNPDGRIRLWRGVPRFFFLSPLEVACLPLGGVATLGDTAPHVYRCAQKLGLEARLAERIHAATTRPCAREPEALQIRADILAALEGSL